MEVVSVWEFCQWPLRSSAFFQPSICICWPYFIPVWHLLSYFLFLLTSTTCVLCVHHHRFAHESSLKIEALVYHA